MKLTAATNRCVLGLARASTSQAITALLLLVVATTGCNSGSAVSLPETFPVSGKVVNESGEPISAGAVEFRSLADHTTRAVAEIQPDGAFSLQTHFDTESAEGAVPGQHEVTVHAMDSSGHAPKSWTVPRPMIVDNKPNKFTIKVP